MESSDIFFDRVLLRNMTTAFDAVMSRCASLYDNPSRLRSSVAQHIVKAARAGERDCHRLQVSASSHVDASTSRSGEQPKAAQLPIAHRNSA